MLKIQNSLLKWVCNFRLVARESKNKFLDARVKISRKLTASDSGLMGEANKLFAQVNSEPPIEND